MHTPIPLVQKTSTFFWLFFLIWVSVGLAAALAGQTMPDWMQWADAWTMILATIITYLWMIDLHGVRKTRLCFVIILIASGLIEFIGTNTGFPFGYFKYTERFSSVVSLPFAPNGLAVIIPFAWAVLCLNAWFVAGQILKWRSRWAMCVLAGFITMLTDINLEAVAWYMRGFDEAYWRWYADGSFTQIAQSVPIQNYIAWFVLTMILLALCPLQIAAPGKPNWKPLIILVAFNLLFLAHRIHYTWLMKDKPIPAEIEFSRLEPSLNLRLVKAPLPLDCASAGLHP